MLYIFAVPLHGKERMTTNTDASLYYNSVATIATGDLRKLAKYKELFGSWENVYGELRRFGAPVPDPTEASEKLARAEVRLVLFEEEQNFLPALRETPSPPFGMYIKGNIPENAAASIAIVGTRRATPEGKNIARRFARGLASGGFCVVSGLAFGIDSAAHEGCLDAHGATIAVLAGGLNDLYPRSNERLAENILKSGGGIISEYPLGTPPLPYRFLERNRIISGLSRGTVIVEAPLGSGSLATARYAVEANRDVFVVPGSITNSHFEGSHALIRQGAELVTSPEEILEAYGVVPETKILGKEKVAAPHEMLIIKALREIAAPTSVDKIIAMTKLEPRIVNQSLAFLLMEDFIKEESGGYTI
jgi:DNA processing protein